jgi:GAF domain-containing protein
MTPQIQQTTGKALARYLEELNKLAQRAHKFFSADISAIVAINPLTGQFLLPSTLTSELQKTDIAALTRPDTSRVAEQVLERGMLFIEDLVEQPEYQSVFAQAKKIQSLAGVSLGKEDDHKPLAVLYLGFKEPRQFGSSEREQWHLFVDQASLALQNAWFTYRHQEIARIGYEMNQEAETVETLFKKLHKDVADLIDISHFFMLAIYQPQTNGFDLLLSERGQYRSLPDNPLNGGYEWVLQNQEPLIIHHLSTEADPLPAALEQIPGTEPRDRESLIFVPLLFNGLPLGLLSMQHPEAHVYDAEDLQLLQVLGNHLALALNNLNLLDNFRQLNQTGQLLTRQLESDRVLHDLVVRIQKTTKADLVILYPYHQADQLFQTPPLIGGELLKPEIPQPNASRPDDLASLALRCSQPIFAADSAELYQILRGQGKREKGSFAKREKVQSAAVVPLRVVGETVGVLFFNFRHSQHFDILKQQLMQGLANYAAIAIKNAREFSALIDRRYRELETLREIDRQISKSLELETVLNTILQLASQRVAVDKGVILLYNPRSQELVKEAAIGRDTEANSKKTIPLDQEKGIARWVFQEKRPIRVGNVREDPLWRDRYLESRSTTYSELDVPLLDVEDGHQVIGVINLESDRKNAFSQADEAFLVTLAGQAVLAIKHAQSYAKQKRLLKERARLHKINQRIIRDLSGVRIFELILDQALEATGAESGTLRLYDSQTNALQMAAGRGVAVDKKGERHSLDEGITGYVARKKAPLNVGDVRQAPWDKIHLPFIPNVRSELAVPMLEGHKLIGVINVESRELHHFNEAHELLLAEFADLAVISIQNVQRYQEAEKGREKLEALGKVDQEIIRQLSDPEQAIRTILMKASVLTGAEVAGLFLYEVEKRVRIYRAQLTMNGEEVTIRQFETTRERAFTKRRGIVRHVAEMCLPYITKGDAQDDLYYEGSPNIHSEVAVPLISEDQLVGVLNLESPREFAFAEEHLRLLEMFAGQAVIAIQNAQNYDRAKKDSHRFQLLYQAAQELGEIADNNHIDDAYDIVIRIASTYSQSEVIIRRFNPITEELVVVRTAHWANPPLLSKIKLQDNRISSWVARTGKTLVVPDIDNPPPEVAGIKSADPKVRSLVNAPIQFEDNFYGNLAFTHMKANYFGRDSDDVKLIEGLAYQLAITIHRLETVEARQEAEQRAQEAEVMGSFGLQSFEFAHRLGNDLGLIRSYINNINRRLQIADVVDAIIEKNLTNVVRDVQRVLDLSMALKEELKEFRSVKQPKAEPTMASIKMLIDEAVISLTNVPSNIQLHHEIARDVAAVHAVPGVVRDVLYNLLTNAIEAMPDGGKITLRAYNTRRYVFVEVSDTGIGITPDKRDKIFGFLYSTKGSTGFGLWSARRKALQNGGDLRLTESRPGGGTTFTLSLPRIKQ